jgi:hypothetical protein
MAGEVLGSSSCLCRRCCVPRRQARKPATLFPARIEVGLRAIGFWLTATRCTEVPLAATVREQVFVWENSFRRSEVVRLLGRPQASRRSERDDIDWRTEEMWDEDDRRRLLRVLEAVGMAQASEAAFDVAELAHELEVSEQMIRMDLDQVYALGLVLHGLEEKLPPMLLTSGRQLLARRGDVEHEILSFLPRVIDDLNARKALLVAGTILVDEFRAALVDGDPVEHARTLVPPAFTRAVNERLAVDLFAASVALVARLSDGVPAGCVAEEIIAVALIGQARVWLGLERDEGRLGEDDEHAASDELRGLFELFEDDDVLNMFDMMEPADAALAGHDPVNQQLGVADQRVESWFEAFAWTSPTGYLRSRSSAPSED